MSSAKKPQKSKPKSHKAKPDEPSLSGVLIVGASTALLGAFCGFLFLTAFQPKVFSSLKDRESFEAADESTFSKPGDAYYFAGTESGGGAWENKRSALLSGESGTVVFSAGELNAWVNAKFRPALPQKGDEAPKVQIVPGVPNFFIPGASSLHLSLPTEFVIYGTNKKYKIFAHGHFDEGAPVDFVMDRFYVNSAPVPTFGGIAQRVLDTLLQAFSGASEYEAVEKAWARVDSASLAENRLQLQVR